VNVAEIWSYHTIGDQTRFTLVHRAPAAEVRKVSAPPASRPSARTAAPARTAAKPRREAEPARRKAAPTRSAGKTSRTKRSAAPKAASARTMRRK